MTSRILSVADIDACVIYYTTDGTQVPKKGEKGVMGERLAHVYCAWHTYIALALLICR